MSKTLYEHVSYPHQLKNVNLLHKAEQATSGFNTKIAIAITKGMGTMTCAYLFALLALLGFPGLHATLSLYIQWVSQTFIQLTALSVLAVGQNVLSRHSELMADEQFQTTQKSEHLIEQMREHLNAQDRELLRHSEMLLQLLAKQNEVPHV